MLNDEIRDLVARRLPPDDGDRRSDDTDAALRFQRTRVGPRVHLPNYDGPGDVLLLLSHVQSSRPLRKGRAAAHQIPGARRRRFR